MTAPQTLPPVRGVDRQGLVASRRYVVAGEREARAAAVRCPSLSACEVTYVDPDFPGSPYRGPLRIGGEQVDRCWMSVRENGAEPPYEDAWRGAAPAGCVSWARRAGRAAPT
jgi:hypothetical protein